MHSIDSFVKSRRDRTVREVLDLLRIPSISSDPAHSRDCRRAAEWVAGRLRRLGCTTVRLLGSSTHPVVHAIGPDAPGKPTVVVYGHYDVQPPDPIGEWKSPPFQPEVRGGRIYGRGATDDKGQFMALVRAFEAASSGGAPPVNIRFLIEGQEESGGDVLLALVCKNPALVRADIALMADGPYYAPGWPAAEVAVRGLCYAEIGVRTLRADVHSGLYGGVAPNAHDALVRILAAMKGPRGRIRIPGVHNSIHRPSRRERESWSRLPLDIAAYTHTEVGASELTGDPRRTVHERVWALPTFDVHGITGGFSGVGAKTVIPAEAKAKVSLRLVPGQRAKAVFKALERFVRRVAPRHAKVSVRPVILNDPALVDTSHPAFGLLDRAFRDVVGRGLSFTRSGGTSPILEVLGGGGAAVIVAGIGLPDDGLHAPNEHIALKQIFDGIRVYGRFFRALGTITEESK